MELEAYERERRRKAVRQRQNKLILVMKTYKLSRVPEDILTKVLVGTSVRDVERRVRVTKGSGLYVLESE